MYIVDGATSLNNIANLSSKRKCNRTEDPRRSSTSRASMSQPLTSPTLHQPHWLQDFNFQASSLRRRDGRLSTTNATPHRLISRPLDANCRSSIEPDKVARRQNDETSPRVKETKFWSSWPQKVITRNKHTRSLERRDLPPSRKKLISRCRKQARVGETESGGKKNSSKLDGRGQHCQPPAVSHARQRH